MYQSILANALVMVRVGWKNEEHLQDTFQVHLYGITSIS